MGKIPIDLVQNIADDLNKTFKGTFDQVAHVLSNSDDPQFRVKDWISTGSDILDIAISNRPNGGFPTGKIVEVAGLNASGKSLIAAHAVTSVQKMGGVAIYYDTESAFSEQFFQAVGIDTSRMVYVPLDQLEDIFLSVESNIAKIRASNKDVPVLIVIDSIMGATTKIESESMFDKDGYATAKSIILSKAMRKLTGLIARERICLLLTNQLRVRMGVSFGDPYSTSGGLAIPFHSSVRLRLKKLGKIKITKGKVKEVVGIRVRCEIEKNRLGAPHKSVDYDIYFNRGIDNSGGWLYAMKKYDLVTSAGKVYKYKHKDEETGEVTEVKFQSKDFEELLNSHPVLKEAIYKEICDKMINVYVPSKVGIDDIIVDDSSSLDEPIDKPKVKTAKK